MKPPGQLCVVHTACCGALTSAVYVIITPSHHQHHRDLMMLQKDIEQQLDYLLELLNKVYLRKAGGVVISVIGTKSDLRLDPDAKCIPRHEIEVLLMTLWVVIGS